MLCFGVAPFALHRIATPRLGSFCPPSIASLDTLPARCQRTRLWRTSSARKGFDLRSHRVEFYGLRSSMRFPVSRVVVAVELCSARAKGYRAWLGLFVNQWLASASATLRGAFLLMKVLLFQRDRLQIELIKSSALVIAKASCNCDLLCKYQWRPRSRLEQHCDPQRVSGRRHETRRRASASLQRPPPARTMFDSVNLKRHFDERDS